MVRMLFPMSDPLDVPAPAPRTSRPQQDPALEAVVRHLEGLRDVETRLAAVFRSTFDQLYNGQLTGRYRLSQLHKTEKTYFGTLIEINMQREFGFSDGVLLDYSICGHEIDCKYSHTGQWMLPLESFNQLVLLAQADDFSARWSLGIIRVTEENRRKSSNRDSKTGLNAHGRSQIHWLFTNAPMQPNALLDLPSDTVERILAHRTGQQRINELFRSALKYRITRNIVATVAQQDDYMKRVRASGGARSALKPEGIIILSGHYLAQRKLAAALGVPDLQTNELASFKVVPADEQNGVLIDGGYWRNAGDGEVTSTPAPKTPTRSRA